MFEENKISGWGFGREKVILSEGIVTSVFTLPHKSDGNDKKS